MKKPFGIGLLELMLALAIIVAVLLVATRYYKVTRTTEEINEASQMINAIYVATMSYAHNSNITSEDLIPVFVKNGSLPEAFGKSTANPWGGTIDASPIDQLQQVRITLTNIPFNACQNLAEKFKNKADVDSTTCLHVLGAESGSAIFVFNILRQPQSTG